MQHNQQKTAGKAVSPDSYSQYFLKTNKKRVQSVLFIFFLSFFSLTTDDMPKLGAFQATVTTLHLFTLEGWPF